jgi:hypothetical protein
MTVESISAYGPRCLSDATPEDVLNPADAREYHRQRRLLWDSLVLLHNNVSVLRRLAAYPMRFLGAAKTTIFLLQRNTLENSLIIAHRLWNESDPRSVSLRTLQKLTKSAPAQIRVEMKHRLKNAQPQGPFANALDRIKRYRHVRLGHIDKGIDLDHPDANLPVRLTELAAVAKALTDYYNATGIGIEAFFDLVELSADSGGYSEVERMLDGIAIQSVWVRQYSEDPSWWWSDYRPKLTDEEFTFLVKLRERMGLPAMSAA